VFVFVLLLGCSGYVVSTWLVIGWKEFHDCCLLYVCYVILTVDETVLAVRTGHPVWQMMKWCHWLMLNALLPISWKKCLTITSVEWPSGTATDRPSRCHCYCLMMFIAVSIWWMHSTLCLLV